MERGLNWHFESCWESGSNCPLTLRAIALTGNTMRCKSPFARCLLPAMSAGLWLAVCNVSAGEKIQFSGRDGSTGKTAPAGQAKSKFEAPDFLGVSRFKKDPLNEFVPLAPTAPARNRQKNEEGDEKDDGRARDSQDQGDSSRSENGERGNQFDSRKPEGQRGMDDKAREHERQREERRREEENSSASTNRFSLGNSDNSKGDRFGANSTRDGKNTSGRTGQSGSALQMPMNARSGLNAKPGFTGLNQGSRGDSSLPGGAYANPGGRAPANGFGNASLPSYMRRDESPLLNRNTGSAGGERSGPLNSGGSFSGALGGAPKTLNDFSSVSGGAKQPSAPAPPPEPPRFERKPAVLEIPKRVF